MRSSVDLPQPDGPDEDDELAVGRRRGRRHGSPRFAPKRFTTCLSETSAIAASLSEPTPLGHPSAILGVIAADRQGHDGPRLRGMIDRRDQLQRGTGLAQRHGCRRPVDDGRMDMRELALERLGRRLEVAQCGRDPAIRLLVAALDVPGVLAGLVGFGATVSAVRFSNVKRSRDSSSAEPSVSANAATEPSAISMAIAPQSSTSMAFTRVVRRAETLFTGPLTNEQDVVGMDGLAEAAPAPAPSPIFRAKARRSNPQYGARTSRWC